MSEIADTLIYLAVVLGRLLLPLLIPRYPLPGVIAALVLDAVDQTIFQVFTKWKRGLEPAAASARIPKKTLVSK